MGDPLGSRFTVVEQIGGGNYGSLYRVIDSEAATVSDKIIAAKKLKDAINHPHVLREVSVQCHAQRYCPHVVRLLRVVPRDEVRAALVLEYVPLDLRSFINAFYCGYASSSAPMWGGGEAEGGSSSSSSRSLPHVPLAYVRRIIRGLLEALQCLHARGIAHRDIKPENILVEPLGLEHPLRCVCPPAGFSACAGEGAGCWVHAVCSPHNSTNGHALGHPTGCSVLESCRCFFDGSLVLHHEMTGEELVHVIHQLHCPRCRRAQPPPAFEKHVEEEEEQQKRLQEERVTSLCMFDESVKRESEGEDSKDEEAAGGDCNATALPLTPDVKLCDFGSARHIGTLRLRSAEEQREELTPGPTTPVYCAPEMMLLQRYGTPVDMWAVGAILFELLTGEFFLGVGTLRSFLGDVEVQDDYCVIHRLNRMFQHLGTPSPTEWSCIAHPLYYPVEVLAHLPHLRGVSLFHCLANTAGGGTANGELQKSPCATTPLHETDQPTAVTTTTTNGKSSKSTVDAPEQADLTSSSRRLSEYLYRHIGRCGVEFLMMLLQYDPAKRLTAAEALQHPFLADATCRSSSSCAAATAEAA